MSGNRKRQPRFPLKELERLLEGSDEVEANLGGRSSDTNIVTTSYIARRLDVQRGVVCRWRREGIPFYSADAAAISLGVHPVLIWPEFHTHEEQSCSTPTPSSSTYQMT